MRDLARDLASALTRALRPDARPPPEQAEAAAIALLASAISRQARARKRRQVIVGLAAAAALAAGVGVSFALLRTVPDTLQVESAHRALSMSGDLSVALAPGARVGAGARVETTSAGAVSMRFATGSRLSLEEGSALDVLSAGADQYVRLATGRVHAEVMRLKNDERFHIATPDTDVEVHGTRFEVEWRGRSECAGQAATTVRVEEGVVRVRFSGEDVELQAGAVWPPPCPVEKLGIAPPAPPAPPAEPTVPAIPPSPTPVSSLAEENRRFTAVLRAKQAGETTRALELLSQWRRDFPHGHLEEDACVEELRLLSAADPQAAQAAARAYLRQFPHGYARPLAEGLLAAP